MAPSTITDDYYEILEVSQTATVDIIKQSYRRLALTRHPDKNLDKPGATAAFQILSIAHSTLIDFDKRRVYDRIWADIRNVRSKEQEPKKSQAEHAENEQKRAAKEEATRQEAEDERCKRIWELELQHYQYETEIWDIKQTIRKLAVDLKRLQEKDDEDLRKEAKMKSWWTYVASPVYGVPKETEDEKKRREMERLQRLASKNIKEGEMMQKEAKVGSLKDLQQGVYDQLLAARASDREAREKEAKKQQEIRRKKQQEEDAKEAARRLNEYERLRKEQAERNRKAQEAREAEGRLRQAAARKAREDHDAKERIKQAAARRAQEAWEAEERIRKATALKAQEAWEARERVRIAAAEKVKAEARERAAKIAEDAKWEAIAADQARLDARKAGLARASRKGKKTGSNQQFDDLVYMGRPPSSYRSSHTSGSNRSTCRHTQFWRKLEGARTCESCDGFQNLFAFECPGCRTVACASCREDLKRGRTRTDYTPASTFDYSCDWN